MASTSTTTNSCGSSQPNEIVELARALKGSPDLIYQYVYNMIDTIPQAGSLKGPLGVLIDQAGTATDQAELMVALLQQSGNCSASLNVGAVEIYPASLQNWLGMDTTTLANVQGVGGIIGAGGFASPSGGNDTLENRNGALGARINWVWVQATINGQSYAFDPATPAKYAPRSAGIGSFASAMGYAGVDPNNSGAANDFLSQARAGASITPTSVSGLNRANVRQRIQAYAGSLLGVLKSQHPNASASDVLQTRQIALLPPNTLVRQASIPNQIGSPTTSSTLPASLRTVVTLSLQGASGQTAGPAVFNSSDLYGRRLSLSFDGSNTPSLRLDGASQANVSWQAASNDQVTIVTSIAHPYRTTAADITNNSQLRVTAKTNAVYVISSGWGDVTRGMIERHRALLRDASAQNPGAANSEPVLGESLAMLGYTWLAEVARTRRLIDTASNTTTTSEYAFGIVGTKANPNGDGTIGPFVDLPLNLVAVTENNRTSASGQLTAVEQASFYAQAGISSILESGSIEQTQKNQAASTAKLLDIWAQSGPIYDANSCSTYAAIRPILSGYQAGDIGRIDALMGFSTSAGACASTTGNRVILPSTGNITVGAYTGVGYILLTPNNAIGHLITGGLSGGEPGAFSTAPYVTQTPLQAIMPVDPQLQVSGISVGTPSGAVSATGGDPLNLVTGAYLYSHDDVTIGSQAFPYGLGFQRSYDSSRMSVGTLGMGWTHNFDITQRVDSDGFAGTAETSPQAGAHALAALYVLKDILTVPSGQTPSVDRLVIAAMIEREIMDSLTNNVVRVVQPGQGETFVKNADGSFSPPLGSSTVLTTASDGSVTYRTKEGVSLAFVASGQLSQWSNPVGVNVNFAYDASGKLTGVSNTFGRQISLAYNGNLISSVSASSGGTTTASTTYTYNGNTLTGVTDPLSRATTFAYDAGSRLTQIFYPDRPGSPFLTNTYDSLGRVMQQADANGHVTNVFVAGVRTELNDGIMQASYFDGRGNLVASVDGQGNVSRASYDGVGHVLTRTSPEGNSTSYTYDAFGNVLTETRTPKPGSPLASRTRSFTYSTAANNIVSAGGLPLNRLLTSTDFSGNLTTFGYGGVGDLVSVQQPPVLRNGTSVQPSTTYTTIYGLKASETDPEGRVTQYVYYPGLDLAETNVDAGRLNLRTDYGYDAAGNLGAVLNPNRHQINYAFDSARQLLTADPPPQNGAGRLTYGYDGVGRVISIQRGTGDSSYPQQPTTTTYSPTGKLLTVTDAANTVVTRSYNSYDDPLALTDGAGRVLTYTYDKNHRLTQVAKFGGIQEARTYSPNGLLTRQQDGRNNRTTYVLDGFDRVSQVVHADGSKEQFSYNADDDIVSQTARAGQVTTYTYDALHRRMSRTSQASGITTTYSYDLVGRLLGISTPVVAGNPASGTWQFNFDTAGRPISELDPDGNRMQFGWDAAGNRTSLTFPGGAQATASYNALEQLVQVGLFNRTAWTNYYDGLGNLFVQVTGNGYTQYRHRSGPGRVDLTDVHTFLANGPTDRGIFYHYTYNGAHQVASTTRQSYNAAPLAHPSASGSLAYGTADGLNRLPGISSGPSYTHDTNGNQTSDGTRTIGYDPEGLGQVLQVDTAAGRSTYRYDPLGRRYSKSINGVTTVYLHDEQGREVAEYSPGNGDVGPYPPGGGPTGSNGGFVQNYLLYDSHSIAPIAVINTLGSARYHHVDQVGTPTIVTDDSGSLTVAENEYLGYGEGTPTGTSFGLAGYRYDPESRLYHVGVRDYDPRQGRFIQPDPIGTQGGINLYAYVGNDPLNLTDPTGLLAGQVADGAYGLLSAAGSKALEIYETGGRQALVDPVGTGLALLRSYPVIPGLGAAGRGTAAVSELDALASRAGQFESVLDPIARANRTTAVLDTNMGRFIAGGGRDLTPAQRAILEPGEIAARLPGAHAEVTALTAAQAAGASPSAIATTRAICPQCAATIQALGGQLTSPTTAVFPPP